jgi:hypothetical protein
MTRPRGLSIVFVRFDRRKHAGAWEALHEHVATLGQRRVAMVIVDNAASSPDPAEEDGVPVVAGDNSAWEFSAFDTGIAWLRERRRLFDLTLLVTDAFRAYGDAFLAGVDRELLDLCRRLPAAAGWVDSFCESLRLLGVDYEAWLRTSYLVLPSSVLEGVQPFAWSLPEGLFSEDWRWPWGPEAPVNEGLRRHLEQWLVRQPEASAEEGADDRDTWHSRFDLDDATFPLFKDKVRAILREHHLSIRLARAGVRRFDLRVLGDALLRGATPRSDGSDDLLAGLQAWRRKRQDDASSTGHRPDDEGAARLLYGGDVRRPLDAARARAFAGRVVPLVRQRFPQAVFEILDDRPPEARCLGGLAGTRHRSARAARVDVAPVAAVVVPSSGEATAARARLRELGLFLRDAAQVSLDDVAESPGLAAERDVALAETCGSALKAALERQAASQAEGEAGDRTGDDSAVEALGTTALRWRVDYQDWHGEHAGEFRERLEHDRSLVKGSVPFTVQALCYQCGRETAMHVDFEYGGDRLRRLPNWRERLVCQVCGLNSKMRATLHVLAEVVVPGPAPRVLVWELKDELARAASARFASVTPVTGPEGIAALGAGGHDGAFDSILVVDMFERAPTLGETVSSCLDLLAPGGGMVFTASFSTQRQSNRNVGTPGDDSPSREFGWSLLDAFRAAHFEDVAAHFFWSPAFGYLGGEQVVFVARKALEAGAEAASTER